MIALFVSSGSLAVSVWTALLRHDEWHRAAQAQISVSVTPIFWKILPDVGAAEAFSPGYSDIYASQLPSTQPGQLSDQYGVFVRIVAKDKVTGKIDPNDAGITVEDARRVLLRRGKNPSRFIFRKHLRFRFNFRNVGTTPARAFKADLQVGSRGRWAPVITGTPADLASGQDSTNIAEAAFPLETAIPDYIELVANIHYIDIEDTVVARIDHFYFAKRYAAVAVGTPPE